MKNISFVLMFIPLISFAQTYKYIEIEDGLSNRRIFDIQKDSKGYMWFLTNEGMDRYDGKEIRYGAYNEAVFSMVGENGRKALRTKWFRHVRENGLNVSKRFFSLHGLTSALRLRGFSADLRAIALHRACRWG